MVDASHRRAWLVLLGYALLGVVSLLYAQGHLGIDTDTDHMFSGQLPWRQQSLAMDRLFPQFNDVLVIVVQGATPEEAELSADTLMQQLRKDTAHFRDVSRPDADPFLRREGLLLLDTQDLAHLLDGLYAAQPLLGPLAGDSSARGLLKGISLMAEGVRVAHADLSPYHAALEQLRQVLLAATHGNPPPLSWQQMLSSDAIAQARGPELLLAHPLLDRGALQPGLAATQAVERAGAALPEVKAGRVSVHYTGSVALSDVQFGALTDGIVGSTVISLLLLALWLFLALRSWRLIVPILLTLCTGLILTLGFAALAVGTLNLISVAFAVLFVGLAVDFAIQFAVRLRDQRLHHAALAEALDATARSAGSQIAVAAAATACGFLAFAPTAFVGVAELGIIAGTGMLIALACTLSLLPALLTLLHPADGAGHVALPLGDACDGWLKRRRREVLGAFAVLGLLGLVAAWRMPFDANPLHTQAPDTEPMRTLRTLADNPITDPFNIYLLAPDLDHARTLAARVEKLPEVSSVIHAGTFVPTDQAAKLDLLEQAQDLLLPSISTGDRAPPITPAALREAMGDSIDAIAQANATLPTDSPLRGIGQALQSLQHAPDANLLAMNAAISRFLPTQLDRLRASLDARPITLQDVPDSIRRDWIAPDGRVRIQVSPTRDVQDTALLRRFVAAVQRIAPDAGGPAVTTIASADTILRAFQQAAVLAIAAIGLVLLLVLRRWRDTGIVLLTLGMSAALTALGARAAGMAINYANIIALPLLLGVGVSFNVYFVMNWRAGMDQFVGSASARAVLFSALTTGTAFGSLALSHDLGMASMGRLLLLSLGAVLLATFVFLPSLLYALGHADSMKRHVE
nr:MMPL family transporter [Dyella sp. ASV21]